MLAPNWLILGTRGFVAHVPSYEKIDFLTGGTPVGGHKNFFGTRDLRQSISHARKPPNTKNQPIRRKNFFGDRASGTPH